MATNTNQQKAVKKTSAQELVSLRNRFYYVGYRKLTLIFLGAVALCALSLVSAVYFAGRKTPPVYVPIAPNGQVAPTYSLDQPSNPDKEVMNAWVSQWVSEAVRRAYTFDYLNFTEQLNSANPYFTYRGWDNFVKSLSASQNLNTVQQQKMIVKFTPKGPPAIKAEKVLPDGRYGWSVELEGQVKYTAHDGSHTGFIQNVVITLVLVRVSTVDSPRGIGIDQIVVAEKVEAAK